MPSTSDQPDAAAAISFRQNRMYRFLVVLTISSTLGLEAWLTLFNNFAVEVVGLDGNHIGLLQSLREIPGFLTFLVIYVLLVIKEHHLSALSVVVLGLGLAATGLLPSLHGLVFTTLISSFGFHYYDTTCGSLTLQYFDQKTSPLVFGKLGSLGAATNIGVGILIFILAPILSYTQIYLLVGLLIAATGVWGFFQDPTHRRVVPQHKKMIFRRRYGLYYFLTFMSGARRQIFMAFAVFLMVKKFGYTIQAVTVLFVINSLISFFVFPLVGRSIVRFGERKVLSLEYASLIFVFVAYATVQSKMMVALLYILDYIFFSCAMAIGTYFQKIADPRDIAPSVAVSFAINHVAAVILPVIGGVLWMVDYRIPFMGGAILSLISLLAVQRIRRP